MWKVERIRPGEVSLVNTEYPATASVRCDPAKTWHEIQVIAGDYRIMLVACAYYTEVVNLFEKPEWTKNPWAVFMALGSLMSYKWQSEKFFASSVISAESHFMDWDAAIRSESPIVFHSYYWNRVTGVFRKLVIKLLKGLTRSTTIQTEPEEVIRYAKLFEPFVKDDEELHKLLQKLMMRAVVKTL